MNEMIFKDYTFGYADAATEYIHYKNIFKDAFYDPKNILEGLIYGNKFLLVGRKGLGKTAYGAKLHLLSQDENSDFDIINIQINQLEYKTFNKLADKKYQGTQKYEMTWNWVIGIEILKYYKNKAKICENEKLNDLIEILKINGIDISDKLSIQMKTFAKRYAKLNIKPVELGYEIDNKYTTLDIYEFVDKLFSVIYNTYYLRRIIFVLDGLDDILRFKKDRLELISGLIRSSNNLNLQFFQNEKDIKIILLIRDDILYMINDPDINKIKRDASIKLIWNEEDLKQLVNLRFGLSSVSKQDYWYTIFPKEINGKDSWEYVLSHTLLRPRDVLQFLVQVQEMFPNKKHLTYSEFKDVVKMYSDSYFIEEMKDELTGLMDDSVIKELDTIFQKIGDREFSYMKFKKVTIDVVGEDKDDRYYKEILSILIEGSYIGVVTLHKYYDTNYDKKIIKKQVYFKYLYPRLTLDVENRFVIHVGLFRALNFSNREFYEYIK